MENALFHGDVVSTKRVIYTPSPFAKTNLIHLQEVGFLQANKPHTSKRDNLNSYLCFLVTKGCGSLSYQGKEYTLTAGDIVFIDCKKPYSHKSSEDLWALKWVHFYGPNMQSIYEKYLERGGRVVFQSENASEYENTMNEISSIASGNSHVRDMKICEKLTTLLTLLMEDGWNPGTNNQTPTKRQDMQAIKEYLDEHYREKILLEDLADQYFISKFYLTKIFKEQYGISINNYIQQVRINHAKQILRFTDYTMEQVGFECGFEDANYFARTFKKVEGISPTEYRKLW